MRNTICSDDFNNANPSLTSSETILEMTYQVPMNDFFIIQPDVQYIIDPNFSRENALIVGVRGEVTF